MEAPAEGRRDVVTVVAAGGGQRFVEATLTRARQLGLTIEVVALVERHPARGREPMPDIVESMGAVSLARRFRDLCGVQPEWDVLHGPTPIRALADYVERTRPRLVALPHRPHRGRWGRCEALHRASRIDAPVLIA